MDLSLGCCWLSSAGDCFSSILGENGGEMLFPVVAEICCVSGGLCSKEDSLRGCGIDIVIIEIILLITPERNTVNYFTLHSSFHAKNVFIQF